MSASVQTWIAAIVTLGAFSYLFKENPVFKAVEHVYVGAAAGYTITMGFNNLVTKVWHPVTGSGKYYLIIPVILGLMLFAPYFGSRYAWMRRYPLSFVIGIGAGITTRTAVVEQFARQLSATVIPMVSIDNLIIFLGVVTVLSYFFFTLKQSPVLKASSEAGKWVIMITFGAAFGNAIMGRISLVIDRVRFLFGEWIHLVRF
jgi:hypothetical protein